MTNEDLFAQACALPDPARAALLDAAGLDDARRAELEALLAAHDGAGSFLARPALTVAHVPSPEQPGGHIGPYKLLQVIGEGGMGVVWMAEQREPVRRMVALKVIRDGGSGQVLARFEAERQALALMDHPNIARVFEAGTTTEGRPYFVMELVKGVPITRFCDDNKLPLRERLALFVQVCHAVQHAHGKGVIHRDLKPSNVLVALYDDRPVPKVIDFGIAKAAGEPLTERTLFTAFGTVVGTLEYMSPEQARLNQLDIDTRSDVYSLGVLLYELLTGTTPLERKRLKQAALDEVLRVIREEEPPPPSTRLSASGPALAELSSRRGAPPGQLAKLVRGELDWIVMKALEKERDRRYLTANNLARDVERHLKDEPVEACPPSVGYRLRKFVSRNRVPLVVVFLFFVMMKTASLISLWQVKRATIAELIAERERDEAVAAHRAAEAERDNVNRANRALGEARRGLESARDRLRRALYVADLKLLQRAWEEGEPALVSRLLERQRPAPGEEDLRHFEWRYWAAVAAPGRLVARLPAPGPHVELSADGTRVAWAALAADRKSATVRVWDIAAGKELLARPLHLGENEARAIATLLTPPDAFRLSADGRRLVCSTPDGRGTLQVWDVASGRQVATLTEPDFARVGARRTGPPIELSADGRRVWVQGGGVFDADSGRKLLDLGVAAVPSGGVGLTFGPDPKQLAAWHRRRDRSASVDFLSATGEVTKHLDDFPGEVWAGKYSPDGKRFAAVAPVGEPGGWTATRVQVWSADSERLSQTTLPRPQLVRAQLRFSPDGGRLAVWSRAAHRVVVLDPAAGRPVQSLPGAGARLLACAFSPDGRSLRVVDDAGEVREWPLGGARRELPSRERLAGIPVLGASGAPVALSPGGELLARVVGPRGEEPVVVVIDRDGKERHRLPHGPVRRNAGRLYFSPKGDYLALAAGQYSGDEGQLRVWEMPSGRLALDVTCVYSHVALSADGRVLVDVSQDGSRTLRMWGLRTGQEQEAPKVPWRAGHVEFSPDGQALACATTTAGSLGETTVAVWDLAQKRQRFRVNFPRPVPGHLRFSPDGKLLALARGTSPEGVPLRLLDAHTGRAALSLEGAPGGVAEVAFSPDGRRLATSSNEAARRGEVQVWDIASGQALLTLNPGTAVRGLGFSADGRRLAACSVTGTSLFLWGDTP